MADFERKIFVDDVEKTQVIDALELEYLVDVGLSNPFNKRYSKEYQNGMNLKELFDDMTSELDKESIITLSNGTKTAKNTVANWSKNFHWNLTQWITDDKNPEQNVFIRVDGKTSSDDDAEPIVVSKL